MDTPRCPEKDRLLLEAPDKLMYLVKCYSDIGYHRLTLQRIQNTEKNRSFAAAGSNRPFPE